MLTDVNIQVAASWLMRRSKFEGEYAGNSKWHLTSLTPQFSLEGMKNYTKQEKELKFFIMKNSKHVKVENTTNLHIPITQLQQMSLLCDTDSQREKFRKLPARVPSARRLPRSWVNPQLSPEVMMVLGPSPIEDLCSCWRPWVLREKDTV